MRSADVDDQSSEEGEIVVKHRNGKGIIVTKKRSRDELYNSKDPGTIAGETISANSLTLENERLSRVKWTEEMERILTECVHSHIRTTPGKGLRQVDWNSVSDEMHTRFPHFEFTRKSLKNKYTRLGGLALESQGGVLGGVGGNNGLSDNNPLNTSSFLNNTSADDEYEDMNNELTLGKLKSPNKLLASTVPILNKSQISVSAILAEDREAVLSEKAIDEFTSQEIYSKIREDPHQALTIIEKLMIYDNAKKFFLVKPESLRVLFVQKWIQQSQTPPAQVEPIQQQQALQSIPSENQTQNQIQPSQQTPGK